MSLKIRLIILNFLEFFAWGAWLLSIGAYMSVKLGFSGIEIGSVYATLGIASLFMPAVMGIIADKWLNAERLLGISHFILSGLLIWLSFVHEYNAFYWVVFFISMFYMPTIALNNSVNYYLLEKDGKDIVKDFPPIRVWGTIGFILAVWTVDLSGWNLEVGQFYVSAAASLLLGIYAFSMPGVPPAKSDNQSFIQRLGLDAFVLFKSTKMAVFFIFAMLLGAALQITNLWGEAFLHSFAEIAAYKDTYAVNHPGLIMSISQISETVFILTIPFFLKRFGIKNVMLLSMGAWVFRFGLFAIGDPGSGLWLLILAMMIYGMAFDFFNISGSLFVEEESHPDIRSSAQGLFMLMTNGLGAIIGAVMSGYVVDYFTREGHKDWPAIWYSFAAYALIVTVLFAVLFRYKHKKVNPI